MKQLLPLLLLFSFSTQAQELLHCGADEMRIRTLQAHPKVAEAVVERDTELEAFTREFALRQAQGTPRGGEIYTVPVVFHVIHKFGNENISRAQILDGLDVLNATLRKEIPDTADIHPNFKPLHADCGIEFRLATKDPEGNCHSGINRISSALSYSGDHRVKDLVHWNPSMYLNVYIVNNAAGLAGHAVWPADADTIPQWDGIVMSHSYMGRIGTSDQTRSVVFAHEVGHYLNLHHIWGGNNVPEFYYLPVGEAANCDEDDLVDDTPNTIGWSNCNLNAASCGNDRDNVQNAMDYSYCNVMFTQGQRERMRASLNSPIAQRNNLWAPQNLAATGVSEEPTVCGVGIMQDVLTVCPTGEEPVTFVAEVYHAEADSLRWHFPGGSPNTGIGVMEEVTYDQPGRYDAVLLAYRNGGVAGDTLEGAVTVLHDASADFPLWESFEGNPSLDGEQWYRSSADDYDQWEHTELAAHSGTRAVVVDAWDHPYLTEDALYGPPLNLGNVSQMQVNFKYAFAAKEEPSTRTRLEFQVRRECDNNWITRLNLLGPSLQTVNPQEAPFVPSNQEEWAEETVNIPGSYLVDGLQFRFLLTTEGGARFYLDDIMVDVNAGINEQPAVHDLKLFPNPAQHHIRIAGELLGRDEVTLRVLSATGQQVMERNLTATGDLLSERIETSRLSAGLYLLVLEGGAGRSVKRFVVSADR